MNPLTKTDTTFYFKDDTFEIQFSSYRHFTLFEGCSMPTATKTVQFPSAGRSINPANGTPGSAAPIPIGMLISYDIGDVYNNGWVGGNACLCIRSYSIIKDEGTGNLIETAQPVVIG